MKYLNWSTLVNLLKGLCYLLVNDMIPHVLGEYVNTMTTKYLRLTTLKDKKNLIHLSSPKMQDKFITCHTLKDANLIGGR